MLCGLCVEKFILGNLTAKTVSEKYIYRKDAKTQRLSE
jgi:hypothetical protein